MDYSWKNKKRDLTYIFDQLVKEDPRFISYFRRASDCDGKKHEWSNCDVESDDHSVDTDFNYTQKFTKFIVVSNSDPELSRWGSIDNRLNRQTAIVLSELIREINTVALLGVRAASDIGPYMCAGGLYWFATGSGALEIDAKGAVLDSFLVNDAAQSVTAEGGEPMQILCSPAKAWLLTTEYRDRVQILRSDERRGAYVAAIFNEIDGRGLTVMADPDVPDTDCWLLDTSCFGLAIASVYDYDAPLDGFDGIRRKVEAEVTFEFKNPEQRCCRIKNLKNSIGFKGV